MSFAPGIRARATATLWAKAEAEIQARTGRVMWPV
ncbi:hypothetical protein F0726_00978 [Acidithiobacillus caldus]|nr:hypothetical protein F0726_00978 [Acidithiobacillus caldus]